MKDFSKTPDFNSKTKTSLWASLKHVYGKWWELTHCPICKNRCSFDEEGLPNIHFTGSGWYGRHSKHVIQSKSFQKSINSSFSKKVSKAIREKGVYVMSHQEEAMMTGTRDFTIK